VTKKERDKLQKEQRLLRYRQIVGTSTRDDRARIAEIQKTLNPQSDDQVGLAPRLIK